MAPLNSYFLQGSPSEQRLVQDLINEQLSIYGQDVVYMPRKIINEEKVIKEITVSKFDDSFRIEAYISTFDGYGGQGDILSKFGVRSTDEITFVISKERYADFITPKISLFKDQVKTAERPQEGDLIYLPLDNSLFEIKYVEMKAPFYQLNNLYVYELRCELFEYEDEIIDTDIAEVDESVQDFGYIQTLVMHNSTNFIQARANSIDLHASLVGTRPGLPEYGVVYIDIINGGSGYLTPPEVRFKKPGGFGILPTVEAILDRGSISKVLISHPGMGYTFAPEITFHGGGGVGAAATAVIAKGIPLVGLTTGGVGYSTAPNVYINNPVNPNSPNGFDPIFNPKYITRLNSVGNVVSILAEQVGGKYDEFASGAGLPPSVAIDPQSPTFINRQGATATATVGAGGSVTAISITNGGAGYNSAPVVSISTAPDTTTTSIETILLEDVGLGYTVGTYSLRPFPGQSPTPVGANGIVSIDSVGVGGTITGISVSAGGTNFAVGERYIFGGNVGASTITNVLLGPAALTASTEPTEYQDNDDDWWQLDLPWNVQYAGGQYSQVFVSTNNFLTFIEGSDEYDHEYPDTPELPKIRIRADDNSVQRIYYGTEGTAPNRTFRIRSEGTDDTEGILGDPNMVYEAIFYEATPNQIDIQNGQLARNDQSDYPGVSGAFSDDALLVTGNLGTPFSGTRLTSSALPGTGARINVTGLATDIGVTATATAVVGSGGTIGAITITNPGAGYTVTPTVDIALPIIPNSANFREATATSTIGTSGTVTSLTITDNGLGYGSAPVVSISTAPYRDDSIQHFRLNSSGIRTGDVYTQGPGGNSSGVGGFSGNHGENYDVGDILRMDARSHMTGSGAIIRVDSVQSEGRVTGFTMLYGGSNYQPLVNASMDFYDATYVTAAGLGTGEQLRLAVDTVETVQGVNATATAVLGVGGSVTGLTITNPGLGYSNAPTVTMSPATAPGSNTIGITTGHFKFNETVTGQTSGVTGVVKSWDHDTRTLKVSIVSGTFQKGEKIVGDESSASHKINSIILDDIYDDFAENDVIETEADKILDFTEKNPFGEL